jgi:hypothetical protein
MKKYLLIFISAAFMLTLSSCDGEQHKKEQKAQKERSERRW